MQDVVLDLKKTFEIKDLGEPNIILGMQIKRNREKGVLTIDQYSYIENLLDKYGMKDCYTIQSPMETGLKLKKSETTINQNIPYQSLVGALMYLVQGTRPDIAYPVHYLSQFNKCYNETHWKHLKRILRYLKFSKNICIKYSKNENYKLRGYCDASWNPHYDGKSVTGYMFFMGDGLVSWRSCKQNVVTMSTCESEFIAMCESIKEANWLKNLLTEMELEGEFLEENKIKLYCDNQAAIKLAQNGQYCKKSKHINLKYLYIRQEIEDGKYDVSYMPTSQMLADILTKALAKNKIKKILDNMNCHFNCMGEYDGELQLK